ncbi:MAG: DNA replication/repair protein RecF [Anaerolineales bacterium]|nr:MAG: DNA replication/repair protein RecF [Anaerolineales bacterium]
MSSYATIPAAMLLNHLSLTNFRNFTRLEIDIPNGSTILVGANAQGKTSLLEAIYYLTGASATHATSDRQLINFLAQKQPQAFARLVAEVEAHNRIQRIEIRLTLEDQDGDRRPRKEILVNGLRRRMRELAGTFNAVIFLPQDMEIVEGSPGNRRHYLDSSLIQADPSYAATLSDYGKVLSQRNALLKSLHERRNSDQQLDFWDEQLCELGATLIRARALALHELERIAAPIQENLTRDKEDLHLRYQPSYDPLSAPEGQMDLPIQSPLDRTTVSREEIRKGMLASLQAKREEERARGLTLIGPHRDDFGLLSKGIDLRLYGSRGQNRTAMLALKLAEIDWLSERTGEMPILLLDEVLAELDIERREDLLQRVQPARQAVLTAADLSMFSETFQQKAAVWQVNAGQITQETQTS